MSKWATFGKAVLGGLLGVLLGLLLWRAYADYTDFMKMRQWVAQVQAAQAEAAKQQAPARAVQAPTPEAK